MNRLVTIKDIANRLGISKSTVSRALSDQWDVRKETRDEVLKMAKELGYRPNPIAKRLQSKRSGIIGIVVPEFFNSFFPKIIIAVQNILDQRGYQLLITQSNESPENEERNLRMLQDHQVEGILISIAREGDNLELYKEIIDSGIPMLFFNRSCSSIEASRVVIDDYIMSFAATEHLILNGKKRIAHLGGPKDLEMSIERKRGYVKALNKYNIPIDNDLIIDTGLTRDRGYEQMSDLLDRGVEVDALFAACDPVALGAMKAIKDRNINIPEQIAVVGFSESRSATLIEPNLTTVAQPLTEMGEKAVSLLLEEINALNEGNPFTHQKVKLQAKLNIRESSSIFRDTPAPSS